MTDPHAGRTNASEAARAASLMPGGVSSPVRAYVSVGGTPLSIVSARGAFVTDVEGREYVDLVGGWGAAILGHAHPEVVEAVRAAAGSGLSFGASSPGEADLADAIASRVAPAERVRLVSTGTEATMTAVRLARAATGRDLIVTFAGNYHGHSDGLLAQAGSGIATLGLPSTAGVPAAIAACTIVVPYNDLEAVHTAFASHAGAIAAILVEAAPANMGVVPPAPDFNAALAAIAHEAGALLILDEVLTGFRVGPAGYWGIEGAEPATSGEPYVPDLLTFGKVIGGGLPVAAVAGAERIMSLLAPLGPVYQAGTLSGNPVAVAAGLATLGLLDSSAYVRLDAAAQALGDAVSGALEREDVPHVLQRAGNLFSIFWGEAVVDGVSGYAAAKRQDSTLFSAFFHAMLDAGVSLPPSAFEAWFVSTAHSDAIVERVTDALPAAARAARGAMR